MEEKMYVLDYKILDDAVECNPKTGKLFAKITLVSKGQFFNVGDEITGTSDKQNSVYLKYGSTGKGLYNVALSRAIMVFMLVKKRAIYKGCKIVKRGSNTTLNNAFSILEEVPDKEYKGTIDPRFYTEKLYFENQKLYDNPVITNFIPPTVKKFFKNQTVINVIEGEYKGYRGIILSYDGEAGAYLVSISKKPGDRQMPTMVYPNKIAPAITFEIGDKVTAKMDNESVEGTIIGKNKNHQWVVQSDELLLGDYNIITVSEPALSK
jgi:hypothetical protein